MTFTFIDLFAGIGGFHEAAKDYNGTCVFASEIDKFSRLTYETNHHITPHGDITKIDATEIPNHDILFAGFPCQPFSAAGKGLGFEDTRGTLFFEIIRIAREKKPNILILENVKRLLTHDKGNTFKVIQKSIEELGYHFSWKLLNSRNFGLPQNRERVYIVASKEVFEFDESPANSRSVIGDILELVVSESFTLSDRRWDTLQKKITYPVKLRSSRGVSTTITARYCAGSSNTLLTQENKNPRYFTPRECARLQGFPDEFVIPVSKSQAYKQFGNAISVPVAEWVIGQVVSKFYCHKN